MLWLHSTWLFDNSWSLCGGAGGNNNRWPTYLDEARTRLLTINRRRRRAKYMSADHSNVKGWSYVTYALTSKDGCIPTKRDSVHVSQDGSADCLTRYSRTLWTESADAARGSLHISYKSLIIAPNRQQQSGVKSVLHARVVDIRMHQVVRHCLSLCIGTPSVTARETGIPSRCKSRFASRTVGRNFG